jgi:hypothetical protein
MGRYIIHIPSIMNYFLMLRAEFRSLITMLDQVPSQPATPFYARWGNVLQQRMSQLRQDVQQERQKHEAGAKSGG